ncbi:MAG TPA: ABC transporter ATP-binding protein [Polyangiaceae bacterium]|nr:ABC transporter ATP-binding protein [Polyangiaceae bacterium]
MNSSVIVRPPRASSLELRSIAVWRGQRQVLHDVCLHLAPGQLWALVGPNGSGKSSLLEALLGALPCSGEILLGGHDVRRWSARERARHLTLLGRESTAQTTLRVRDLVELGRLPYRRAFDALSSADHSAVDSALQRAGVLELEHRSVNDLSDGEKQRVFLARAFAQHPELILLDEATSHLDILHREQTLQGIRAFVAEGRLALMAIHDLELAVRHASHVAILSEGRIVASGPALDTLTPTRLAQVFGIDAEIRQDERGNQLRIFGLAASERTQPRSSNGRHPSNSSLLEVKTV